MKGSEKNASSLGPKDPKMPGGVTGGPHGARIDKESMREGCCGVGRVGEDDDESSRRPVQRERANDSKAWSRRGGRSDTCRHQRGRVVGKRRRTISMVWASKPLAVVGFPVSAAKPGANLARSRSKWRARGIISDLTLRRREVEEEPCPSDASSKIWTVLPLRGCLSQLALLRYFSLLVERLKDKK